MKTFWPYPNIIMHRGAGTAAPENTMSAFKLCAQQPRLSMFECDVKLTADSIPILMHDDHLDRTTNGCGLVADTTWDQIQLLDAGSWHSPEFAGERVPSLTDLIRAVRKHHWLVNLELKPNANDAIETAKIVARKLNRQWPYKWTISPPLVTSFNLDAMFEFASRDQIGSIRGLLFEDPLPVDWLDQCSWLQAEVVVFDYRLILDDPELPIRAKQSGLKCLAFTVNGLEACIAMSGRVDGIITDNYYR